MKLGGQESLAFCPHVHQMIHELLRHKHTAVYLSLFSSSTLLHSQKTTSLQSAVFSNRSVICQVGLLQWLHGTPSFAVQLSVWSACHRGQTMLQLLNWKVTHFKSSTGDHVHTRGVVHQRAETQTVAISLCLNFVSTWGWHELWSMFLLPSSPNVRVLNCHSFYYTHK